MNINLNIPIDLVERIAKALERIAYATERSAPPDIQMEVKPYSPDLWGYSSNAQSRQFEEEDRRTAQGFGPAYELDLEARAGIQRSSDLPDRFQK